MNDYFTHVNVTFQLNVDPEYHPQIIGRKGEVINKIRNDHNVTISLPKKEDPDNIISITGAQPDVEAAKEDILNIVQRLVRRRVFFLYQYPDQNLRILFVIVDLIWRTGESIS